MNSLKISMVSVVLGVLGLGLLDTAQGQVLTASPSSLNLVVQSGGASATAPVNVTYVNGPTTLIVDLTASPSWMTINNTQAGKTLILNTPSNGGPAVLNVTVNTTGLTGNQVGTFTVRVNALPSSLITYTVNLTLGTPSSFTASPQSLSFSAPFGASVGNPNTIPVSITSTGGSLGYTLSASTTSGGTWILLNPYSGTANTGSGFNVQVNPSQLAVGSYYGTITVSSTTTSDTLTIPVTLQVTQGQTLNVTGTPLNTFVYQAGSGLGGFTVQTQYLQLSTNLGSENYTIQATSNLTTNWLIVSPQASTVGTTPLSVSVYLSSQYVPFLTAGTYNINLAITASSQTINVPVTLIVSNNPLLSVSPMSLSFSIPFNQSGQQGKNVTVNSSNGSSIPYLVTVQPSAQGWLSVNPSSGTTISNPVFEVFVNPIGFSAGGTYTGNVTISPNNSDAGLYSITLPVTVNITAATTSIAAGPDNLLFSYQLSQQAQNVAQLVNLTGPAAVGFSVSATTVPAANCPGTGWLTVTPSALITPAQLSVSVNQSGMTSGTCSGTVTVTYNNGVTSAATVTIPVTVNITATSLLTVSTLPGFGVVTATYGNQSPINSSITVGSTDGTALQFQASASSTGSQTSWLFLSASSGTYYTTPQAITVQISPGGLPVGTYTGSIVINALNAQNLPSGQFTIPITLTVTQNATVTVSPQSLSFTQPQGAAPPASQSVMLNPTGATTFQVTVTQITGGNWLQVSPASGNLTLGTMGTLTAAVLQNSLSPGTYNANINIYFPTTATSATIPVSLRVTAAQTVTATPTSLTFGYQLGSAAPMAQTVTVSSTGGAVTVTTAVTLANGPTGWLQVTPTSGSTGSGTLPLSVSISATAINAAGTYTGTIAITQSGATTPFATVSVTLNVTGVPVPQPVTIFNSASSGYGAIAPGELITIKGNNIGPSPAVSFTVNSDNTVSNTLGGVQVLFGGIPGTPIYVSPTQVNVIVPYEIAGQAQTNITLIYQNQISAGILETVAAQAPGIFTFNATGSGQAAALNQNFTYNGPAAGLVINGQNLATTPASAGQVIALFMTGGGQTNPPSSTGTVTPTSQLYPIANVTASINGVPATVAFAGAAPGEVTGVMQVNVIVPTGVHGNNLSVVVTVNGVTTVVGPTVAVQ